MCGTRETPTSNRPLSKEDYEFLRAAQHRLEMRKLAESGGRKPVQSVQGFTSFRDAQKMLQQHLAEILEQEKSA